MKKQYDGAIKNEWELKILKGGYNVLLDYDLDDGLNTWPDSNGTMNQIWSHENENILINLTEDMPYEQFEEEMYDFLAAKWDFYNGEKIKHPTVKKGEERRAYICNVVIRGLWRI